MSRHVSKHVSRHRVVRTGPRVSLGHWSVVSTVAALLLLAGGVRGTYAAWTDNATVGSGAFTTGTLDITLNGNLVGPGTANNPGTWTNTSLALANMAPGESVAVGFPVRNNGSIGLKYTVTGTGSGGLAVANGMQFATYFGVSPANSGTEAAGTRTGSCGGVTPTDSLGTTLTAAPSTFATDRVLAAGAQETVCIVARLNSTAGNALQGQSMTASLLFAARQLTA